MTIQEMFNLIDVLLDASFSYQESLLQGAEPRINDMILLQDSMNRTLVYLPMFTPMSCRHCKHTGCNRKRDIGVCSEYVV